MRWRLGAVALLALAARTAAAQDGAQVSGQAYEGWRQYSVHCARCHGQDVLGNPVAADLLKSAGPGGPMEAEPAFTSVVMEGRHNRGMPAFKGQLSPAQAAAIYAYVHGRAAKQIPPGRPRPARGNG